jgi:hypothetical protein
MPSTDTHPHQRNTTTIGKRLTNLCLFAAAAGGQAVISVIAFADGNTGRGALTGTLAVLAAAIAAAAHATLRTELAPAPAGEPVTL